MVVTDVHGDVATAVGSQWRASKGGERVEQVLPTGSEGEEGGTAEIKRP